MCACVCVCVVLCTNTHTHKCIHTCTSLQTHTHKLTDTHNLCLLCVQVWSVRVDVHVLDHCGNITDCATVAAITALKHFRLFFNYYCVM